MKLTRAAKQMRLSIRSSIHAIIILTNHTTIKLINSVYYTCRWHVLTGLDVIGFTSIHMCWGEKASLQFILTQVDWYELSNKTVRIYIRTPWPIIIGWPIWLFEWIMRCDDVHRIQALFNSSYIANIHFIPWTGRDNIEIPERTQCNGLVRRDRPSWSF